MRKNFKFDLMPIYFLIIFITIAATAGAQPIQKKAITWQNDITVKDAANNQLILKFGQAQEATDGMDAALGEQELPPYPPSGIFDARFLFPAPYQTSSSWIDFRNSALSQADWQLKVQSGAPGFSITYTWNKSAFPAAGQYFLRDLFGGIVVNVNMKQLGSYTNTNSGLNPLKIECTGLSYVRDSDIQTIDEFYLYQNYPNPFNPATTISYFIPEFSSYISLKVFDLLGKEIAVLADGIQSAGIHSIQFDASVIASGTYYYVLRSNGRSLAKLMTVIR